MRRDIISKALIVAVPVAILAGTVPVLGANAPRPPDPCDRELSANDVSGILIGPVSINHYSMMESLPGEGCELGVTTNGVALVDITIRKANRVSLENMLTISPHHKSISGIGDEAYVLPTQASNIPDAKETDLYARKGELQCIGQLHRTNGAGEKLVIPSTDDAIAAKLGALCIKLFAARSGG